MEEQWETKCPSLLFESILNGGFHGANGINKSNDEDVPLDIDDVTVANVWE